MTIGKKPYVDWTLSPTTCARYHPAAGFLTIRVKFGEVNTPTERGLILSNSRKKSSEDIYTFY